MNWFKKEDTSNRCYNGGNLHNYQPRFDEQRNPTACSIKNISASELRSLLYYHVYVKDICTWCGKEIKR
jgi:hypothetical protein